MRRNRRVCARCRRRGRRGSKKKLRSPSTEVSAIVRPCFVTRMDGVARSEEGLRFDERLRRFVPDGDDFVGYVVRAYRDGVAAGVLESPVSRSRIIGALRPQEYPSTRQTSPEIVS